MAPKLDRCSQELISIILRLRCAIFLTQRVKKFQKVGPKHWTPIAPQPLVRQAFDHKRNTMSSSRIRWHDILVGTGTLCMSKSIVDHLHRNGWSKWGSKICKTSARFNGPQTFHMFIRVHEHHFRSQVTSSYLTAFLKSKGRSKLSHPTAPQPLDPQKKCFYRGNVYSPSRV